MPDPAWAHLFRHPRRGPVGFGTVNTVTHARFWAFVCVMVCQFAFFEMALRLEGGSEAAPAFQTLFMSDQRMGYRLRPGAETHFKTASFETDITINSSGTRGDEIGPKESGERRIVVLGDSLVLSVQVPVEQTFCRRLEARLNQEAALAPCHYRVINAGVQGYGPVEDWLFYKHVASRFDPDLVLVVLFVGNDAIEAADQAWRLDADERPSTLSTAAGKVGVNAAAWVRRTMRRSMVLQTVRLRLLLLTQRFGLAGDHGVERPLTAYLRQPPGDVLRGLEVARESVSRIAAMAATANARTAVVLMPARFQVNDTDFASLELAVEQRGETLLRNGATDRFRQTLAGLPIPVMDALPPLFNAPRRSETFFEDTIHLTRRGHQIVADAIERFLLDSRLLPMAGGSAVVNTGR